VHRKLGGLLHEARDQGKRVALYVRVSTDRKQTITNQKRALDEIASNHGWKIVAVFKDEGISGIKGREKRPGFDALLHGSPAGTSTWWRPGRWIGSAAPCRT
jgi:hypothetical protein